MVQKMVEGMPGWRTFAGFVFFILFTIALIYLSQPTAPKMTQEQFSAQVAEQNRQADVASQLRAAERGYLAERTDGRLVRICKGGEYVNICDDKIRSASEWASLIERVIKPEDRDWGGRNGKAYEYLSGP